MTLKDKLIFASGIIGLVAACTMATGAVLASTTIIAIGVAIVATAAGISIYATYGL